MKSCKLLLIGTLLIMCCKFHLYAQNVGIGTKNPLYKLTVQTPGGNWGIVHTDSSVYLGSFIYSGAAAEFGTRSNHPFYLMANNQDAPPAITIEKNGVNVGFGNINPVYNLDIHSSADAQINLQQNTYGQTALISRYTNRMEIEPSDNFEISVAGIDKRNLFIPATGFVGINTGNPSTQLQVLTADGSYGVTHTNGAITVGTYVGSGAGWLGTQSNHPLYFFTNNSSSQMTLGTNGYLGINSTSPVNKLQVGNMGSSGLSGNDIAFGNGTQASGIAQTATAAQWYSTTDIVLMPRGTGHGRVGINVTAPNFPLEVDDYVSTASTYYDYFKPNAQLNPDVSSCSQCSANVSISAQSNIAAQEVDVFSDVRIKDIEDTSNSSEDLETLNRIKIIDYTLKDKVKNGNRPFKKVIAQQVESVYPQIVSKHTDFIPNVYRPANRIIKTDSSWILVFDSAHHISKNAGVLKVLTPASSAMTKAAILSMPSDNKVEIRSNELQGDMVFVYGEEVNDFRTVDYDGLTTLSISATQELSKLVKSQQEEIKRLDDLVAGLEKKVSQIERKN